LQQPETTCIFTLRRGLVAVSGRRGTDMSDTVGNLYRVQLD